MGLPNLSWQASGASLKEKELLGNVLGSNLWFSSSFANKFSNAVSTISDKFFQIHSVNNLLYNQQNEYHQHSKDFSFVAPDRFNLQSEQSNINNFENSHPKIPLKSLNTSQANPKTKNTIDMFKISSITNNRNQPFSNSNIETSFSIRKKLALLSMIFPFELKKIGNFYPGPQLKVGARRKIPSLPVSIEN